MMRILEGREKRFYERAEEILAEAIKDIAREFNMSFTFIDDSKSIKNSKDNILNSLWRINNEVFRDSITINLGKEETLKSELEKLNVFKERLKDKKEFLRKVNEEE